MSRQLTRRLGKQRSRDELPKADSSLANSCNQRQPSSTVSLDGQPSSRKRTSLRRSIALGAVLGGLIAFCFVIDTPGRVCNLLATRALERFDIHVASEWVERSHRLSARNAETALIATKIARQQGDLQAAAAHLRRAQSLGANRSAIRLEQLMGSAQSGMLDGIEAELVAELRNPQNDAAEISDAYSNGLAIATRFDDAFAVLEAWQKDFVSDPRPHYRMGRLQEHLEQWQESEASYRIALDRKADYFPARFALGRVLLVNRQIDQAIDAFDTCLSMPQPHAAMVELAACHRAKGEPQIAVHWLRKALADSFETLKDSYRSVEDVPDYFEAASMLGDLEAEAGNLEEAVVWFRLAIDKNPRDTTARYGLALVLRQLERTEEAEEEFARVQEVRKALERAGPLRDRIKADPNDLEARLRLGELLLEHESEKVGIFWIRSIFTFDPDYAPAHKLLAEHYRSLAGPSFKTMADYHHRAAATRSAK